VGDYSLRDVRLLGFLGYRVEVADLAPIPGLTEKERFIEVDLNDAVAIRGRLDGPYHLIILGNVLEHVPNDALALASLSEKLAPNGRLILDVPLINPFARFPQDKPDYHIQAYTPRILDRLTGLCGLETERRVYRGVLLNWWYTLPFRGLVWLSRRALGEHRTFGSIVRLAGRLLACGERSRVFRWFCPWSWAYGCLLTLRRAPARASMAEVNRREFLARPEAVR
jgi:SAM-dependent methyltransferase